MRGGVRTFAALSTDVSDADKVSFRCGCADDRFLNKLTFGHLKSNVRFLIFAMRETNEVTAVTVAMGECFGSGERCCVGRIDL